MAEGNSYGDVLSSIMSNPDTLNNVMQMAKKLMDGQNLQSSEIGALREEKQTNEGSSANSEPMSEENKAFAPKGLISGEAARDRERLLTALRPYLSPERRELVDTVLKLSRLAKLADSAGKLNLNSLLEKLQ